MDSPIKSELDDLLSDSADLERPLCVSLHGTLIRTDIWWEHLIAILRKQPYLVFLLPLWVLGGRARLERAVEARSKFDVATLPYRTELLAALRAAQAKGRRVVLSAPGEAGLAQRVADHLVGVFTEVVADDKATSAEQQSARLRERFGAAGFDFVAHAASEQPLLAAAEKGFLISAGGVALSRARALGPKVNVLSKRPSVLRATIKVLRVHQWSKNALVVVPLLLAPTRSLHQVVAALLAALSFSLCASSGYVFNDLIDIEADRAHHTKYRRPFASGALPAALGPLIFFGLFGLGFAIALSFLPLPFTGMLAAYFVATMSYSLVLKSKLMVDVVVLAGLYTHRVLSGGIATGIEISTWLLAFSLFMFSSLAFAKRFVELHHSAAKGGQLKSRGYFTEDLAMVASMGPTAGYIAVLLFCLYIQESNAARAVYRTPALLWFLVPVLLYWISRVWFLANRGQMQDDPVKFALTDRRSWACGAIAGVVAVAARLWH